MRTVAIVGAALLGGLALGLAVSGHAQEDPRLPEFLGTLRGRTYTHAYKMPRDIGVDRDFNAADRIDERRRVVLLPDLYGEMTHVTPHGDAVVFWFRDAEGIVRNAVLEDVTTNLYDVRIAPSRHIDYSFR